MLPICFRQTSGQESKLRPLMSPSRPCHHLNNKTSLDNHTTRCPTKHRHLLSSTDYMESWLKVGSGISFSSAKFDLLEPDLNPGEHRNLQASEETSVILDWLGSRYSLTRDEAFSDAEVKLLTSIGAVLDSRYRMIVDEIVGEGYLAVWSQLHKMNNSEHLSTMGTCIIMWS